MEDNFPEKQLVKVEKIVEKVLIENRQQDVLYFSKIYKHWEVIVGAPLAQKTAPMKLEKKTLFITVEDAAYSHHLRYFEQNMVDLIASPEICGEGAVKRIVFRVGSTTPLDRKIVSDDPDARKPVRIDPQAQLQSQKVSGQIRDRNLQKLFARFMSKTVSNASSSGS
ncbi:MAG: DUF721 domain-containing protein [Proteobacteria bacterium]|nr:DUF721 domain-containing protein [Pseudomonadota bacterium]